MFTLSSSAISASVFKSGCMVLVHHFETVVGSLPSCWANHFPCLSVSASTALILLSLTTSIFNKLVYDANLLIVSEASKTMAFYRLKIFFEVFSGYADRLHSGYLTLQCQPSAHRPKGDKQRKYGWAVVIGLPLSEKETSLLLRGRAPQKAPKVELQIGEDRWK